jgi:hypothetical protein
MLQNFELEHLFTQSRFPLSRSLLQLMTPAEAKHCIFAIDAFGHDHDRPLQGLR